MCSRTVPELAVTVTVVVPAFCTPELPGMHRKCIWNRPFDIRCKRLSCSESCCFDLSSSYSITNFEYGVNITQVRGLSCLQFVYV